MPGKKTLTKAEKMNIQLVELHFTDMHGNIKSVTIPADSLEESLKRGTWFDGSSIEGFTRIAESDMYLRPDPSTFAVLPWENEVKTARFICDIFTPDDKHFEGDPRHILRTQLEKAKLKGFDYYVGPELEFFLFEKHDGKLNPLPHDRGGYFDFAPRDKASKIRSDIVFALKAFGIETEMSHHEVATGQHEIDFHYGKALETADNAVTFKYVVKSIANIHNLHATFMPKPIYGENGSGMHVHQSLWKGKTNVFYDEKGTYRLSKLAKSFVAGQLEHAKALAAVVAPTVNSYKRLVPGYEAPVYICWAQQNRSALIRIPRAFKNASSALRAELRFPDPSANPYLAFATMLSAGLDGMDRNLNPPKPVEENAYHFDENVRKSKDIGVLPGSLYESLLALKSDKVVLDSLGNHLKELYISAKEKEWDEYRLQVTDWEIKKYFETT